MKVSFESLVDPKILTSRSNWALSAVRKPQGKNPEHAFLILQGIDEDHNIFIKRFDLFMDNHQKGQGVVVIKEALGTPTEVKNQFDNIIFREDEDKILYHKSWNITPEQAEKLEKEVLKDKANPPKYNVLGRGASGGSVSGHSCFTWAKEKLNNLGKSSTDDRLEIKSDWQDVIANIPSRSIGPKSEAKNVAAHSKAYMGM